RGVRDGALGAGKLPIDKLRRMKAEQRMRVAVIADFVAGGVDGARDLRQALHVRADLKERGGRVVFVEQFQYVGRGFAGAVVKCERDCFAAGWAMVDRGTEYGRCAAPHRPGKESGGA